MGSVYERVEPYLLGIFVSTCNSGYNIIFKLCLIEGISPFALLVYAQAFATIATALLSLLFERRSRPKVNIPICVNIFFLGLLGTSTRVLHSTGLQRTTSTFTSSIFNLYPAITFILAVVFRMERLEMRKVTSQAKVAGTVMALGGASLMTLYKGTILIPAISGRHSDLAIHMKRSVDKDWMTGSLMVLGSGFACAGFSILQNLTIRKFLAPLHLTFLVCFVGTFQTAVVALAIDRTASTWRLGWNIKLFSALYNGIVVIGIVIYATFLVIRKRGPVFSSAFGPLGTVVVAILDLLILKQSLHIGSALGAILIIVGLYMVLWAKSKDTEMKPSNAELPCQIELSDSYQNQRQSAQEETI